MRHFLFVLTLLLFQQSQQSPATASIEGSVLKLGTTDAIPRAKVTLSIPGSPNAQSITTDDVGKFVFRDLAPGQYKLVATRDGYVTSEYGQRGPGGSGVPIVVAAQQQVKNAGIEMTPTGAISGRIMNRYGETVGNASVQALRYTYQEGRRTLTSIQTTRSNDLGEYRLFWMTPGQYVISAQPVDALGVDPGGTIFFQGVRGGGPALAAGLGAQLGVGGVTRITVSGVGAPSGDFPGVAPPPPPPPPPPPANPQGIDDSTLSIPVYYPGTTDVTAASPVDLRAGGNVGGINLTVVEMRPVRVRGQVLSSGRPAAGAQVSIYQRSSNTGALTIRNVPVNNETGSFEFRNIAPGNYELVATLNAAGPGALLIGTPLGNAAGINAANVAGGRGRVPGAPTMGARAQVDVLNTDVENISLLLENGFNVTGRLSLDGRSASDGGLTGVRVQLQADPLIPPLAVPAAAAEADGSFSISGLTPGNYRLTVAGYRNAYLKSATLAGVDVLNGGVRLDGEPRGTLDIVLGTNPGSLDAVVVDSRKMPVPAVTAVLVPDVSKRKRYDIFRQATSDSNGRIHLDSVVPGDYKLFAWEIVESNAWTDPDFIRVYENNGVTVHVGEGGRASAEVTVIPYKVN